MEDSGVTALSEKLQNLLQQASSLTQEEYNKYISPILTISLQKHNSLSPDSLHHFLKDVNGFQNFMKHEVIWK